jgi:hypothetical protein
MRRLWNTTSRRIGSSLVVVLLTLVGLAPAAAADQVPFTVTSPVPLAFAVPESLKFTWVVRQAGASRQYVVDARRRPDEPAGHGQPHLVHRGSGTLIVDRGY